MLYSASFYPNSDEFLIFLRFFKGVLRRESRSVKLTDSNILVLHLLTTTDHLRVNMLISPILHFRQMSSGDEKSWRFVHYDVNGFQLIHSNYFK